MAVDDRDLMVSFDVVSLFTKVPIEETLEVINQGLDEDKTLLDRTPLEIEDICALTELCLRSTYFHCKDQSFEQIEGAAMGSPLSSIIPNISMNHLERKPSSLHP